MNSSVFLNAISKAIGINKLIPDPLNFPDTKNRKSIILYYYTVENRPSEHVDVNKPHSALWKKRGGLDKRGNKTRDFS